MNDPVTRRDFVESLGLVVAAAATAGAAPPNPGRREALLSFREGGPGPGYVPAAFFLHFDGGSTSGRPRSRSTSSTSASRAWTS